MIKGCSHHVLPYESGWCVINEANQKVIAHFETQQQAMEYASQCAHSSEGSVLVHNKTPQHFEELSTVSSLPQQENLPDFAHMHSAGNLKPVMSRMPQARQFSAFDPLLGFDEYYFDI